VLYEDDTLYLSAFAPVSVGNGKMGYSGTVLPKLPETVLPYAFIYKHGFSGEGYYLEFTDTSHVVTSTGDWLVINQDTAYKLVDGAWVKASLGNSFTLVWANVDVYLTDDAGGGLYLAASNPVPIYE
jgi:hypothetical protein